MELVYFKNIWIDHSSQYRWLQFDYQLGVFLSRSSIALFKLKKIWLMSLLQFINVLIILAEVLTFFSPTIWIVFIIVFYEGLLGGAAYVRIVYFWNDHLNILSYSYSNIQIKIKLYTPILGKYILSDVEGNSNKLAKIFNGYRSHWWVYIVQS